MSHPDSDEALTREWQAIAETLLENLPVDAALLRRAQGGSLEVVASAPDGEAFPRGDRLPRDGSSCCDRLLTTGRDLAIGTGDELFELGTARYGKEWVVLVTDTVGNPVANTTVQMTLRSLRFFKGEWELVTDLNTGGIRWVINYSTPAGCPDEDVNRNGFLDPGEDINANGSLEAGNVATVAAVPASAPPDDPCATAGAGGNLNR